MLPFSCQINEICIGILPPPPTFLPPTMNWIYCHNPNSTTTQLNLSSVSHEDDFTPPAPTTGNPTSSISQLLLILFWTNFKGSFPGSILTRNNPQIDICLGNIWPGNIVLISETVKLLTRFWLIFKAKFLGLSLISHLHWSRQNSSRF